MNSNEQQIESLILQGYHPIDALLPLMTLHDPNFGTIYDLNYPQKYDPIIKNYPHYNSFNIFGFNPVFKNLKLSPQFVNKWFTYPSGLTRTPMLFAGELPIVNLSGKLILTPDLVNSIKFKAQTYIQDPLYIPVVRYVRYVNNVAIGMFQKDIMTSQYCGNYYFYEPYSDVYLLSNTTMIAPHPDLAYYVLLGSNQSAFDTLVKDKFSTLKDLNTDFLPDYFKTNLIPVYLNWFNMLLKDWTSGRNEYYLTEQEYIDVEGTDIEQKLCFLAKQYNIDIILFTYSTTFNEEQSHKFRDEILDTRSRERSNVSLYREL